MFIIKMFLSFEFKTLNEIKKKFTDGIQAFYKVIAILPTVDIINKKLFIKLS